MPICHVNADDFGLHHDIDRGIVACIDAGRVTGLSLSPNGSSVDWALARELAARVQVGVHVTLVGEPWMSQTRAFASWSRLMPWLILPGSRAHLELEIRTQISALIDNGIKPTHMDSHQHVHLMSPTWALFMQMAQEFSISRIRTPVTVRRALCKRSFAGRVLQILSERRRRELPNSLPCIGLAHAGHNTVEILRREIELSDERDLELVAHPAFDTPALRERYGTWKFDWETERNALLSAQFKDACAHLNYEIAAPR